MTVAGKASFRCVDMAEVAAVVASGVENFGVDKATVLMIGTGRSQVDWMQGFDRADINKRPQTEKTRRVFLVVLRWNKLRPDAVGRGDKMSQGSLLAERNMSDKMEDEQQSNRTKLLNFLPMFE